ncbi:heterokaryon incompatibility protein domain-containing protein [Trichoderma austrokoningii]
MSPTHMLTSISEELVVKPRRCCDNCQRAGNFIAKQLQLSRMPDADAHSSAHLHPIYVKASKSDTIRLGSLADLQANQDCTCCQSIVSALAEKDLAPQSQLHRREAELSWDGDVFSCTLRCHDINDMRELQLRLTALPGDLDGSDPGSFAYWKYKRLMDVNKIDITVIQAWIESCDRLHGPGAQSIAPLLSTSELPWLYLIDLERQCVVKVDTAQSPRYMALSYVWGGVDMLKTTTSNLQTILQPGALLDGRDMKGPKLAQTIVDAMGLARKLGCPFFWTDCICIVQDDDDERTMFLNGMASIYANAYLTIVAGEGSNGHAGISGVGSCSKPRDVFYSEMRFPGHTLSVGPTRELKHAIYCKNNEWATRGWTFQEAYLSRRLLVFTSVVSFHCQKQTNVEWDWNPHGLGTDYWTDRTSFVGNVPDWPDVRQFIKVAKEYSHKRLSFDDDVLYAFAGVTAVLKRAFHSAFHYGLPEVFFDASLLWESDWTRPKTPQLRKTQKLSLPSWSWVRIKGPIKTRVWQLFAEDLYKDTSFSDIYELKPRVQWWKTSAAREAAAAVAASKPITYRYFDSHASMPPGWDPPTSRTPRRNRSDARYSPTLSPDA